MSDGVLQQILRLEQQIEVELAEERRQAEAWLAERQQAAAQKLQSARDAAAQSELPAARRRQLRAAAAARLRQGRARLRRLDQLGPPQLLAALQATLAPICGEDADDRPDGEG